MTDRSLASCLTPVIEPRMLALPRGAPLLNGAVSFWWRAARVFL